MIKFDNYRRCLFTEYNKKVIGGKSFEYQVFQVSQILKSDNIELNKIRLQKHFTILKLSQEAMPYTWIHITKKDKTCTLAFSYIILAYYFLHKKRFI